MIDSRIFEIFDDGSTPSETSNPSENWKQPTRLLNIYSCCFHIIGHPMGRHVEQVPRRCVGTRQWNGELNSINDIINTPREINNFSNSEASNFHVSGIFLFLLFVRSMFRGEIVLRGLPSRLSDCGAMFLCWALKYFCSIISDASNVNLSSFESTAKYRSR